MENEYIDILVTVPVKLRCRIGNAADLADAYDQAEDLIDSFLDAMTKAVKDPAVTVEDTDCMEMDYDSETYDPFPSEDRNQAVKDLGEWRSAS